MPLVMGVVNVTPDSFSDGGRFHAAQDAIAHGLRLLDEGADWLDVGGESTRPGAAPVEASVEQARVIPVIRGLARARSDARISVDTRRASVAAAAIAAGARMVNDVSALEDPRMGALVAAAEVDVVLMHMRGTPATMQHDTRYGDVVGEVAGWLAGRVELALAAGVARRRVILDPGIGFGKAWAHNPRLIRAVPRFAELGHRVLIGASRKRFIGEMLGVEEPSRRVFGSVGAALAAAAAGASILRVHDVRETIQALHVFWASSA